MKKKETAARTFNQAHFQTPAWVIGLNDCGADILMIDASAYLSLVSHPSLQMFRQTVGGLSPIRETAGQDRGRSGVQKYNSTITREDHNPLLRLDHLRHQRHSTLHL